MAVNCTDIPRGVDGFVGVTAIETSAAEITLSVADSALFVLLIPSRLAEMVESPSATGVATPFVASATLLIVAADSFDDVQVT